LGLRVVAVFLAEAVFAAGDRIAAALPPGLPPFFAARLPVFFPRSLPLFLPPPVSSLTVAQARRAASFSPTPRFS
jgi:hypothetical protein